MKEGTSAGLEMTGGVREDRMPRRRQLTEPSAREDFREHDGVRHCASLSAYGTYLWGQGRWEEARVVYERALAALPQNLAARRNLAVASSVCGLHDKAIDAFVDLVAGSPDNAALHNAFGLILHNAGQLERAGEEFSRAVDLAPTECIYWHHKGTNALARNRIAEAVTALARAVALPGAPAAAYYNLAMALGAAGETERAAMFLQKAVSLVPDDTDLLMCAARIMDGWGQRNAAIECLRAFDRTGRRHAGVDALLHSLAAGA